MATALLVAACAAALALLLSGGGGPSVSEPVAVGPGPLRVATGERSVWVTSAPAGTLTRIDVATGAVSGPQLRLARGLAGVAVGGGFVWVSSPRSGAVLRIDGDRGKVEQRIDVGGRPGAIVYGGDRVWVADESGAGITAINAAGGTVFRRGIPPHSSPLRLAVGGGCRLGEQRRDRLDPPHRPRLGDTGPPIRVGGGLSGSPSPGARSGWRTAAPAG